ncbi:MAG: CDGSH iron-sulfur domain-containing protein [Dehalococcoidia bacterium]|nr:MAG: CDGSH iron-sulfur domain-containing protein [Dehalococcoidia bacterium]
MEEKKGYSYRVKVIENGPYIITGGVPLSQQSILVDEEGFSYEWDEGKKYPFEREYSLCRCGNTKTIPFCDKSHLKVSFDGSETASRDPYLKQAEEITGPDLDLTDVYGLCAFARFCDRAGGIWELTHQSDEEKARQTAIQEASNCPSGRLVVWDKKGKAIEPTLEPSIVLVEDQQQNVSGPIWVRGGIQIEAADGTLYEARNRVTLCRCGRSINKPFCDASHIEIQQ